VAKLSSKAQQQISATNLKAQGQSSAAKVSDKSQRHKKAQCELNHDVCNVQHNSFGVKLN
jgi:hypothetical protein